MANPNDRAANRAIFTDIVEFRARVLVVSGRTRVYGFMALPEHGAAVYSITTRAACLRYSLQARGPAQESGRRLGDHAAAMMDGHVPQAADRLASTRARRAAAARAVRSAGTASPRPKYISSGVCPRNAECGTTVLCSWT